MWRPANGVACLLAPTVVGSAYELGGGTAGGGGSGRRGVSENAGAFLARATDGEPGAYASGAGVSSFLLS